MNPKLKANENKALTLIKALKKRNMDGYYFNTSREALEFLKTFIEDKKTVSWGGSMTLQETGILDALNQRDLKLLDRSKATSAEEVESIYLEAFSADYYLMSTNAITLDGKLVNIDGNGNRVAALIFGPKKVVVVAGMNKVEADELSATLRVQNTASPANTTRLNKKTPCASTGVCHSCLVDDCICCHTVITRKSRVDGRITVLLIGEELGY